MVSWMAGRLAGWFGVGWLIGGWLVGWLAGSLVDWRTDINCVDAEQPLITLIITDSIIRDENIKDSTFLTNARVC